MAAPSNPTAIPTLAESRPPPVGTPKSIFEMVMSKQPPTSSNYSHEKALHRPVPVDSSNELSLGHITRRSLPYFLPWVPTAAPSEVPPDFSWVSNSCGGKAAIGVFGGGIMGLLMGVFLGAMSDATPTS